jgi:hypothetical protein
MKVLIVVARGLHLGYIGCYGNEWVETPALDRLAADGVAFDQHYADQPDSAGAQRAWQIGCYRFPSPKPEEDIPYQESANFFALLSERNIATCMIHGEIGRNHPATPAGWQHCYRLESVREGLPLPERISDTLNQALMRLARGPQMPVKRKTSNCLPFQAIRPLTIHWSPKILLTATCKTIMQPG